MATLVAAPLALLIAPPVHAHVPVGLGCAPHPTDCPTRGACIVVDDDLTLDPTCNYQDVRIYIAQSGTANDHVVLDCAGARIHGAHSIDNALDLHSHDDRGVPLEHVTVRNCNIEGYKFPVSVYLNLSAAAVAAVRSEYLEFINEPIRRDRFVEGIDGNLRARAPQNIRFENVHISDAGDVGFYVFSHVHDVTFINGSSCDSNKGPGVYLDTASRHITIQSSEIANNTREGIAIDSSAFNRIQFNDIHDNSGGIYLFKNFWENPATAIPRVQHSKGNEIVSNTIRGAGVGVWIAHRQSKGRRLDLPPRGDPVYFEVIENNPFLPPSMRWYRERAEDNLVLGNTIRAATGVLVYDDQNQIIGNHFEPRGFFPTAISVGNDIRKRVGEPVRGTLVRDNTFHDFFGHPVELVHCAEATSSSNNWRQSGGAPRTPYSLRPVSCNESRATLWQHAAIASGFQYRTSFNRSGIFRSGQRWVTGDFNGDQKTDVVRIYGTSDGKTRIWLQLSTGSGFETKSSFQTMANFSDSAHWLAGDYNGDGLDDLIHVYRGPNNQATAWVHQSTSEEFEFFTDLSRLVSFSTSQQWLSGDVDGDGLDDLIDVGPNTSGQAVARVHRATGSGYLNSSSVTTLAGFSTAQKWRIGDFNRDGLADLVNLYEGPGGQATAWMHHSLGGRFAYITWFNRFAGFWAEQRWVVTDFNNDSRDDLVNVYGNRGIARAWRHASTGGRFEYQTGFQTLAAFSTSQHWLPGDFSGDGFGALLDVYGSSAW